MATSKDERIKALKEKEKQIKARIAQLQSADKAKERKQETRKKIILGGIVLNLIKSDAILRASVKKELEKVSDRDKELFKNL